jgi:hypothetical protein
MTWQCPPGHVERICGHGICSLDMVYYMYHIACAKSPGHGKCQPWYGNVYLDMIKVAQDVVKVSMDKYIVSLVKLCPCPDNLTMSWGY